MAQTVLVVDDDPDFLQLLATFVSRGGYEVVKADGPFSALDLLEKSPPDAILLDIMMPDRSGLELLEQIRWEKKSSHLPVICISAVTMAPDALDFIGEFSVGLMDKSDIPAIVAKLQQVLSPDGGG